MTNVSTGGDVRASSILELGGAGVPARALT